MKKKLSTGYSHIAFHNSVPGIFTHSSFYKVKREKMAQTVRTHLAMMQYGVQKVYLALLPFLK